MDHNKKTDLFLGLAAIMESQPHFILIKLRSCTWIIKRFIHLCTFFKSLIRNSCLDNSKSPQTMTHLDQNTSSFHYIIQCNFPIFQISSAHVMGKCCIVKHLNAHLFDYVWYSNDSSLDTCPGCYNRSQVYTVLHVLCLFVVFTGSLHQDRRK